MAVADHGLEVIRKAAEDIGVSLGANPKAEYLLRTKVMNVVTGEFTFSGLSQALKITTMQVTDVATAMPATALTNRNAISVQNKDATNTVYIGNSDVTADTVIGTTSGFELGPNGFFGLDITDDIVLYARCETGKTAIIKITEVA